MSKLLEGKTAVMARVANKWSLAFAIAESFAREGATISLTYLNEKQKETVESMAGSGESIMQASPPRSRIGQPVGKT